MTKLALDSFLPSGAFDIPANGPIAGTASHSGLDRTRSKLPMAPSGDASSPCGKVSSCAMPVSPLAHDLATQSPPLNSTSSVGYFTSGFLADRPPFGVGGGCRSTSSTFNHPKIASLSPPATWGIGAASLARSVSADAVIPPLPSSRCHNELGSHPLLVDRSNLDALRRRAEQLYHDQQAVMDEMSDEWLKEKAEMSQLIRLLRERVQRLEGENAVLKSVASHHTRMHGLVSPQNSIQGGSLGGLHCSKSPSPHGPRGHDASDTSGAACLPLGLDGVSRRPHFARQGFSPCLSPGGAPIAGHFASLRPRTEPQNSASTDFLLASSPQSSGDVSIIDVNEIDPKLEGIPIKATAVQKPTFEPVATRVMTRDSAATKPAQVAPSADPFHQAKSKGLWGGWERDRLRNHRRRSSLALLTTTRDQGQAKDILDADECRRLTMHAGHTPNHSLSLIPTMTATESSPSAARSRETTPATWPCWNRGEQEGDADGDHIKVDRALQSDSGEDGKADDVVNAEIEGYLEPADDVPLKGPLMIKNIPAQDEIFLARVNQLLDTISRGEDALPKILQSPEPHAAQPSSPRQQDAKAPEVTSAAMASDDEAEDGNAAVEDDVPLVFKSTSNFGAPFGAAAS